MPRTKISEHGSDFDPLADPDGRLEQSLPADTLLIPWLIELRKGGLLYGYYSPAQMSDPLPRLTLDDRHDAERMHELGLAHIKAPSRRILDEFRGLAAAPDEKILAFARRWGVLDLCRHGLPVTHSARRIDWGIPPTGDCEPLVIPDKRFPSWSHRGFEPLEEWRGWAQRAGALMNIAAELRASRRARRQDWDAVARWRGAGLHRPTRDADVDEEWRMLCSYVNDWCEIGQASPHISYRGDGTSLVQFGARWGRGRLFGTIGLQLMARVSGVGSMAVCASCGRLFTPTRIPKPLDASYCPGCRQQGVPVLMAKRRLASRRLKALEMREKGVSLAEIVRAVGSKPSTVAGWIGKKKSDPRKGSAK